MITKTPLEIGSLLDSLEGNCFLRLSNGILYNKLREEFLDTVDEVVGEMISDNEYDILINVASSDGEIIISCHLDSDNIDLELKIPLSDLYEDEILEIYNYLSLLSANNTPATPKIIIRKKSPGGMLDIHQSARKLNCSQNFLKKEIPCTDYSYQEINGTKEIKEYYWSQKLIDRLCQIKSNGAKTEDRMYIAETCCHGDYQWAEEILISLGCRMSKSKKDRSSQQTISAGKENV